MNKGTVQVFCGEGSGKTTAAIGKGVSAVGNGKSVIMIQFLKGSQITEEVDVLKRFEPDMKVFRFEKSSKCFASLNDDEKKEECVNIRNGLNFARKVLSTGECDLLILDEVLGLIETQILTPEELTRLIEQKDDEMDLILTGKVFPDELYPYADNISKIDNMKVDNSF